MIFYYSNANTKGGRRNACSGKVLRNRNQDVLSGRRAQSAHIHAIYGDDAAAFDIRTGEMLDGGLPARAIAMVREWISKKRKRSAADMGNAAVQKARAP